MKLLLLIVTLALEPGVIYLGFFAKRILFRWYSQAGAFILPLLSLALAYALWQEATAAQRLAVHIDPYPRIASTLWVPPIPGSRAEHWIFTTADGREAVAMFYADDSHRRGWSPLTEGTGPYLLLRKGPDCLDILASENPLTSGARETTVIYTLQLGCAAR